MVLEGLLHGILGASFVATVCFSFVAITGSMGQVAGAWGEDNTRDILEWAKRRRLIYGWVDNIEVQGGDVDHLVAAPGGWFAIDSKWHGRSFDAGMVWQDATRASQAARRASLILLSLKHRSTVHAVAACWGGARDEIPGGRINTYGVEFVSGAHLKAWITTLTAGDLDRQTARSVLGELQRFRRQVRPSDASLLRRAR